MKLRSKKSFKRQIITGLIMLGLVLSLFSAVFLSPKKVQAQWTIVNEVSSIPTTIKTAVDKAHQVWEKVTKSIEENLAKAAWAAFKAALQSFLHKMAYQTAEWIATGAKGQKPAFMTGKWDDYINDAVGAAVGTFAEEMAKGTSDKTACQAKCDEQKKVCDAKKIEKTAEGVDVCLVEEHNCGMACDDAAAAEESSLAQSINNFICSPDLDISAKIVLNLPGVKEPSSPQCNLSTMKKNWESQIRGFDFAQKAASLFDPRQTDIGTAMYQIGGVFSAMQQSKETAEKTRGTRTEGVQAPKAPISGKEKAPTDITQKTAGQATTSDKDVSTPPPPGILSSTVAVFTNTLMSKAMSYWLKKGLQGLTDALSGEKKLETARQTAKGLTSGKSLTGGGKDQGLYQEEAGPVNLGQEGARIAFADLLNVPTEEGGVKDIVGELLICPNSAKPGPINCVIDNGLAEAIRQGLTLGEAVDQGLIKKEAVFGFDIVGEQIKEPAYNEGYPYRSLIILRKYRVAPVGWEIAAEYIKKFPQVGKQSFGKLMQAYAQEDSPFYGLVDPSWVLTLPEVNCRRQGYGFEIIDYQVAGGYDQDKNGSYDDVAPVAVTASASQEETPGDQPPTLIVSRQENYCADEQSCIKEDSRGKCLAYGYCQEEKRIWDLRTDKCEDYYNTCQTFMNKTGSFSYLQNTLDWNGCNADNAGCNWYCQDYDPWTDNWTCYQSEEVWQACSASTCNSPDCDFLADQCRVYQNSSDPKSPYCDIPLGGTECTIPGCGELPNLVSNAGFEEGKGIEPTNWALDAGGTAYDRHYHQKMTFDKAHGGKNVLRSYALSSTVSVSAESVPISGVDSTKDYTFSVWIYNDLVQGGGLEVKIVNSSGTAKTMTCAGAATTITMAVGDSKGAWVKKSCDLAAGQLASGDKISLRTYGSAGTPLTGTVYFDDLELKEKCATASQKMHLGTDIKEEAEIYLDNSAKECEAQFAGCSAYIGLSGADINYLPNNSFEEFTGTIDDGVADVFPGWQTDGSGPIKAVKQAFVGSTGAELIGQIQAAVKTASSLANRTFTLSFKAKNGFNAFGVEVACAGTFWIAEGGHEELRASSQWMNYETTFTFPKDRLVEDFSIYFKATSPCRLDAMSVEESDQAGEYKDYGTTNQVYLNKPPDYYGCRGYTSIVDGMTTEAACKGAAIDITHYYDRAEECERAGYTWNEIAKTCTGRKHWRSDIQRCVEGGSEECQNYSLYCRQEDVGCNLFTPVDAGEPVAGRVSPGDYCPVECVGYETYQQSMNDFENETIKYFIAATAPTCSASAAGCNEFTNLDTVAAGGEGLEYYTSLRQCVKESDSACTTFYSWEGDDQTGYQIKTYLLRGAGDGSPEMTDDEDSTMDCQPYYGLKSYQQGYDAEITPDCREIYDREGKVYYHRFSRTITCSNDCHALRWTTASPDADINEENCREHGGEWGDEDGNGINDCIYWAVPGESMNCAASANGCREYIGNIGNNWQIVLSDDFEDATSLDWQNASVSTEAITFGNHALKSTSNSIKKKINSTCHLATCDKTDGCACQDTTWGVGADTVPGDTALADCWVAQGQDSCSYKTTITAGKSYLISFWAKMPTADADGIDVILEVDDDATKRYEITPANYVIGQDWQIYNLGPVMLNEDQAVMNDHLVLLFAGLDQTLFIDQIIIKEVQENIYAIKEAWQTPYACDNALGDPYGQACGGSQYAPKRCDGPIENDPTNPPAMIGCRAYQDASGNLHTLRQFTNLCREELVGCQTLLDTKNSATAFSYTYHAGDPSAVYVPADEFVYLVADPEKTCPNTVKGCSRLGRPVLNEQDEATEYADVYLINDPDQYDQIMCLASESSCEAYETGSGQAFFKNPGQKLCVYQEAKGAQPEGWYKLNSTAEAPDCPSLAHPTYRTIGDGHAVKQPVGICIDGFSGYPNNYCFQDSDCYGARAYCSTWVGACPGAQSACTEFIDPVSAFNSNVVYNPDFRGDVDDNQEPDGWTMTTSGKDYNQSVSLERNTLYVMGLEGSMAAASLKIVCENYEIYSPDQSVAISHADCDADAGLEYCAIITKTDQQAARLVRLYNTDNSSCRLYFSDSIHPNGFMNPPNLSTDNNGTVIMRRAAITYNLDKNIDYTSCNGIKDLHEGCILMNRRQVDGALKHEKLLFSSYLTGEKDVPTVCSEGLVCDANVLVKANSDRTCDKWFFCEDYEKRKDKTGQETAYCADLGLCNSLNKDLACNSFVFSDQKQEQVYGPADVSKLRNLSGYGRVGYAWSEAAKVDGYYPLDLMTESGAITADFNGSFERLESQTNPYSLPEGWEVNPSGVAQESFAVVNDPAEAQRCEVINGKGECLDDIIPPDGHNFLRINTDVEMYVHENSLIKVFPHTQYIISGYVNTRKLTASGGEARAVIALREYDVGRNILPQSAPPLDPKLVYNDLYLGDHYLVAGQDWKKVVYGFTTQGTTSYLSVVLAGLVQAGVQESAPEKPQYYPCTDAWANCSGKIYYDDIQILPALRVGENNYLTRSCRLYTKDDSLSCEYVAETGVKNRGWSGYCLQTDPNNKNYCLQWWPLDLIKGADPMEDEGLKLAGPIYYCLMADYDNTDKEAPLLPVGIFDVGIEEADSVDLDTWFIKPPIDLSGNDTWAIIDQIYSACFLATSTEDTCTDVLDDLKLEGLITQEQIDQFELIAGAWYGYFQAQGWGGSVGGSCTGLGDSLDLLLPDLTAPSCTNLYGAVQEILRAIFFINYPTYQNYYLQGVLKPYAFLDIIGYKQKYSPGQGYGILTQSCGAGCKDYKDDKLNPRARNECSCNSSYNKIYFGKRAPYCSVIVETMLPNGENKAWNSRVTEGSSYQIQDYGYTYASPYYPYGAIRPPKEHASNPEKWGKIYYLDNRTYLYSEKDKNDDGKIDRDEVEIKQAPKDYPRAGTPYGCQKLDLDFSSTTDERELVCKLMADDRFVPGGTDFSEETIAQGIPSSTERLKRIFAESYNWYVWNDNLKKYESKTVPAGWAGLWASPIWSPPDKLCSGGLRPTDYEGQWCAIPPKINNIKVNNKTTDLTLSNGYGQVTLTFNPDLDQEQLPMKRIVVDWGDGTQTDLANLSMLDRPNADNPLQLTHYYYYRTFNSLYPDAYQPIVSPAGTDYFAAGNCPAGGGHACFKFVPRIRVWDNWDWCSGAASGQYGSSCKTAAAAASDWMAFGRAVYVSEP